MNAKQVTIVEIQASTQLLCQQCAAPLVVEQGRAYATCEYCNTVNYLDKSEAVLHYAVRPTLDGRSAEAALRRWMAGNDTVKGLDKAARIDSQTYQLFPMWLARAGHNGEETIHLEPAAALSIVELGKLRVPASQLEPYDYSMDAHAVVPTVPLTAARTWLAANEGINPQAIREIALVHVPIYLFKYHYNKEQYTAMVDAASGQVFAAIFPEKYELPYVSIGAIGCLAYFLAALVPGGGFLIAGGTGLSIGILIYLAAIIVLAIPIFIAAATVSRRY
jgi:small basic protein